MTDQINHSDYKPLDKKDIPTSGTDREQRLIEDDFVAIKVYRRRWLMLVLFVMYTMGSVQWLQYTMVTSIITKYYSVSPLAVKSTAIIYNALFPLMLYPILFALHTWGLRRVCAIAVASTCLGSWLSYLAASYRSFSLALLGQGLVGAFRVLVLSGPAALAARWFAADQQATATAVAGSGVMIGIGLFAIAAPILIRMHDQLDDVEADLRGWSLTLAVYYSFLAGLIVAFFEEEPELPPNRAKALQKMRNKDKFEFWSTVKRLSKNKNYILLWNANGLILGHVEASNIMFLQFYLIHFKDRVEDIGRLTLLYMLSGIVGSVIFGKILDKTKAFKPILLTVYSAVIIIGAAFNFSLCIEINWIVYVTNIFFGFFSFAHYVVTFETGVELTYPEPEGFCVILLILASELYSAALIVCCDKLISWYSDVGTYVFLSAVAVFGFIVALFIKDERRRQKVIKKVIRNIDNSPIN